MGKHKKNAHRHKKAGLCLPVHVVRTRYMKRLKQFQMKKNVDVLFAAYVEPVILDLLKNAAVFTEKETHKRISVRDIAHALHERKDTLLPATVAGEYVE